MGSQNKDEELAAKVEKLEADIEDIKVVLEKIVNMLWGNY